jgi:hypothetical protein
MGKLNIIGVILITIVANVVFVYISYMLYNEFRLSIFQIFFGLLPLILYLRKSNGKSKDS